MDYGIIAAIALVAAAATLVAVSIAIERWLMENEMGTSGMLPTMAAYVFIGIALMSIRLAGILQPEDVIMLEGMFLPGEMAWLAILLKFDL